MCNDIYKMAIYNGIILKSFQCHRKAIELGLFEKFESNQLSSIHFGIVLKWFCEFKLYRSYEVHTPATACMFGSFG